jgi:crotonobetaine/carnitine-CoA ligase
MLLVGGTRGEDLFLEYLDDPDITARSFVEEHGESWLRTSDLVVEGPDGALKFVGRVDDVIKVAGENVSLTELEAVIARAPGVLEVAVLPQPDAVRDIVPVAYVVARDPSAPPSASDLDDWATHNLTPQCRPRAWTLVPELPRTSVGKLRRSALQRSVAAPGHPEVMA